MHDLGHTYGLESLRPFPSSRPPRPVIMNVIESSDAPSRSGMVTLLGCLFIGIAFVLQIYRQKPLKPTPPGPPGEPILGNARQIPEFFPWYYFTDLAKSYGDVIYLTAMGQGILVINSSQAMSEILTKNSSIFSGRPHLPMLGDLVGWNQTVTMGVPGKRWQSQRKLLHQFLGAPSIPAYHHMMEELVQEFVRTVAPTSQGFNDEFIFTMAKLTLRMAYGIKIESREDPLAIMAEEAALNFEDGVEFGRYKVDLFPVLRLLPSWFPLAEFHRIAARWRPQLQMAINTPFDRVKKDMAEGKAEPSFTAKCLESLPAGTDDDYIKWTSGAFYVAASRTTMTTISTFLHTMIQHPEVQAKAQAEIDRVTGGDRLPTFADRPNMPYLDCIFKEVMRWHPATPMGVPHATTEEVQYRGWSIPKGTIVYNNGWALSQDPVTYPAPEKFDPERFERNSTTKDPREYAFGFGRRACPGQAFADATVWITMTTLLALVDMRNCLDEAGNIIPLKENFNGTVLHNLPPFPYTLEPRSSFAKGWLETGNEKGP
ncbi:cytochrome P450 [Clavulina sp. PMI_390]|nr:cytochrome P450 [Clavulina sp. PMI_390]